MFATFQALHEAVLKYAQSYLFALSLDCKNFTPSQFAKVFGSDIPFREVKRRGYFYCGQCGLPSKGAARFRIQFGYNESDRCYYTKADLSCHQHTHPLKRDEQRLSARTFLDQQKHLTTEEIQYAMELGATKHSLPKAREAMRHKFPSRDYDSRLLARLLQRGLQSEYGSDPDCIQKLLALGNNYRGDGGVFEIKVGHDLTVSDVAIATRP